MVTKKPTKKTAKKPVKSARSTAAAKSSAARAASAGRIAAILKLLCAALASAGAALEQIRNAQTDQGLRDALSREIEKLDSKRGLAEDELGKGVGEGVQGVGK